MRARFAASILIAGALLLGSTGCTFTSPIPTQFPYGSADGADATVGQVKVRNALLVTGEGSNASLVMGVSNDSEESVEVLFQYNFDSGTRSEFTVALDPDETISFGSELEPAIVLTDVDIQLGGDLEMFVQYGSETGSVMRVPVYDGSLPRFDGLVPEVPEVPEVSETPDAGTDTEGEPATEGEGTEGEPAPEPEQ